jgi:hypothetical protein
MLPTVARRLRRPYIKDQMDTSIALLKATAARAEPDEAGLAEIPVHDLGPAGAPALLAVEPVRARALLAAGRGRVPYRLARLGDRISGHWLARSGTPYLAEIEAMAATLGRPGVLFLNASYEWACTSGVGPSPDGPGNRLLRALDWPLPGLGLHLVAARHQGPAGTWINLTWPGFAGAIQGLAQGRFAAAINQAPMRRHVPVRALDWAIGRSRVWRRPALPPAHLLRLAFETCPGYAGARKLLSEAPIALPAIFTLCGPNPGETCVIERTETAARVREGRTAAANHWSGPIGTPAAGGGMPAAAGDDRPRGENSHGREAQMRGYLGQTPEPGAGAFAWLKPPILNPTTRLAMVAEPASGALTVRGYEASGPVTRTLSLGA